MMQFLREELSKGWVQIVHTLEIHTEGGRQKMNCANTEGIFRIIQSIPSPKAEPFKRWLVLERKSGKKVLTRENYLKKTQSKKLLN